MNDAAVISLAKAVRFQYEPAQQAHVLLYPEGMIKLNESAAEIIGCCDGARTVGDIIQMLTARFPGSDLSAHVHEFLEIAHGRGWISIS
jgi:pyrroloquinoline quinone biosynthesis protein D